MKRIVILGAGESGAGAAVLAKVKGFETFVSDMSEMCIRDRKCTDHPLANSQCLLRPLSHPKSPYMPPESPLPVYPSTHSGIH